MKRLLLSIVVLVIVSGAESVSAQTTGNNQKQQSKINLSLWTKMSTQNTDSMASTSLNLGLVSSINRLNGIGINLLGSVVHRDMNGVQITGISSLVGNSMRGVQISGISNVNGEKLSGASIAGLVNITGHKAKGLVLSGLSTIVGDNAQGVFIGGLLNMVGENSSGIQLAGLSNISGSTFSGINMAGALGIVGKDMKGLQLSGLANIVGESMKGVQIAGLGNITAGEANGAQIALFNMASSGKGMQIGLVNYCKESFEGVRLGLVNAYPDTKVQLMLFGGNSTKVNAGVRFKNKLFYTILGGGTHYLDFSDKFSAALFYRAGLELPLYKKLFISGDLGFQHIETFKNKDYGFPKSLYALQGRINLECRLTNKLGLFATGGYGNSRHYGKGGSYDKGLILEGGVVLF